MKYLCDNCSPKIGCTNRFENKKTECDSYVPMNNEQFIRFCNTEQLAEWMALRLNQGILLALRMKYHCADIESVREWLKEKHD